MIVLKNIKKMDKIPTAEEFINENGGFLKYSSAQEFVECQSLMIEFAKLHVQAALKEASEGVIVNYTDDYACKGDRELDSDYILNAYPLENIK